MLESESSSELSESDRWMQERVKGVLFHLRLIDIIYLTWFLSLNSVLVLPTKWFLQMENITTIITYNDPSLKWTLFFYIEQ